MSVIIDGRPCGPLKSSKNPTAYTKDELVDLAMKRLKVEKPKASRLTKEQLCQSIDQGKLVSVAKPKAKAAPSKTKAKAKPAKAKPAKAKAKAKSKEKKVEPKEKKTKVKLTPYASPKLPEPKVKPPKKEGTCIERSNLELREHQIRVVEALRKRRGIIAAHDTGSGKTLTAVTAGECFLDDHPKGKVIVVTPVSLQENFKKEQRAYGVSSKSLKRYEFYTLQGFAKEYNKKRCGTEDEPVLLIIDEAHNLRTDISKAKSAAKKRSLTSKKTPVVRAEVAIRCARTATKVLLLTATSVYNDTYDLANLAAMIKGIDPPTQREWERISSTSQGIQEYFRCLISFYNVPKTTEDYPSSEEHYVEIPMNPAYHREYMKVEQQNSHLFSAINPWRFLVGMRQASNALESCPKCEWSLEKVKEGKKTLIYSAFVTYGVRKMQEMLDESGIAYAEVTGSMPKAKRDEAVKEYNAGKVRVLFITKAGGEGLDLKGTRNVIIFESSWNRATELQVIGRAIRYKSHADLPEDERNVNIYHLLSVKPHQGRDIRPSADTYLQMMTEKKQKSLNRFIETIYPVSIENQDC